MYVRMIRRENAGSLSGGADERMDWRTVFSGRFPEKTDEKTVLRLLWSGIPGMEENVDLCEADESENSGVLVEFREEPDGEPVYKNADGDIVRGPEENETVSTLPPTDGGNDYCKMLVLLPGERPYWAWIRNRLESLQRAAGGYIEFTYPFRDSVIVIGNDEAKLVGMKGNRRINGEIYAGPLMLVRDDYDGDIASLTEEQIKHYSKVFSEPEYYSDEDVERSIKIEIFAI